MKEVYELWSFCIHFLHRMVPALADLAVPVDLVAPAALAALAAPAAPAALAALAAPADLVVPRPWVPQSPVRHRNSRTLVMPKTLRR